MHNSATKQLSINGYRNSEDSSLTPNSTPPLTGNLAVPHRGETRSSVGMSISNPTQEREELQGGETSDDNINAHIGIQIDRENRQTFASSHAEKENNELPHQVETGKMPYHVVQEESNTIQDTSKNQNTSSTFNGNEDNQ